METSWNYKKELKPQGSVFAIDLNPRSGFAFRPNFILKNEQPANHITNLDYIFKFNI